MVCFQDIQSEIQSLYFQPDVDAWRIVLAVAYSHYYEPKGHGPVWLMINGRQGSGKTEICNSLHMLPTYYALNDLTRKTLFSNYIEKRKGQPDKPMALMLRVKPPPIIVMKDFSTVITKNQGEKPEILNQLRQLHDGTNGADTGVGGVKWSGRVTFISACVPGAFEQDRISFGSLGERFVDVSITPPDNRELNRYLASRTKDPGKRRLSQLVLEYLAPSFASNRPIEPIMPKTLSDPLADLVATVGLARTSVKRDRNTHHVDRVEETECTSRLWHSIESILLSNAAADSRAEVNNYDIALVTRVCRQSIPPHRLKALRAIHPQLSEMDSKWNHTTHWHMPPIHQSRAIEELSSIGLIHRDGVVWYTNSDNHAGIDALLKSDFN